MMTGRFCRSVAILGLVASLVLGGCQSNRPPAVSGAASSAPSTGAGNNRPPFISKLSAQPRFVDRAMTTSLECQAEDPDGDPLTYQWKANAGNIMGQGVKVSWVAPNSYGDYVITATVDDGKGGVVSKDVTITVACPVCPSY